MKSGLTIRRIRDRVKIREFLREDESGAGKTDKTDVRERERGREKGGSQK